MKHFASKIGMAMLLTLCATLVRAAASHDTPEARAGAFYAWFLANDSDSKYPLRNPAIEQYVAKDTVARLKYDYAHSGPPDDVDYFLKVQDYDPRDWRNHVVTHPAIVLGHVAVVPVTFGSKDKVDVLVFMRMLDGTWKVTKVTDTADYK